MTGWECRKGFQLCDFIVYKAEGKDIFFLWVFFFFSKFLCLSGISELLNEASYCAARRLLLPKTLLALCVVLILVSQYIQSIAVRRGEKEMKQGVDATSFCESNAVGWYWVVFKLCV